MTEDAEQIQRLDAALADRYRVARELGEGGMATVYLADDLRHDRQVAIKVLKPELAAVVGAERFLAEIRTTANLQHPHILPLFDSGEADGFLFFVMPYVEGESLRERLDRERQLSVAEALDITRKVAEALDYAHDEGVVHRDIKPANILLSGRGEPLVADFGIALAVSQAGGGRITETGLSLGTPHYMSPEQATGERDVDLRTDVWALGCVLYEMLAGEPPFAAPASQAVLARILTEEPRDIRNVRKSAPEHVAAVLSRALEKLPADRFADVGTFRRALDDESFRHSVRAPGTQGAGAPTGATGAADRAGSRLGSWIARGSVAVLALVAGWTMGSMGAAGPEAAPVVRVPVDLGNLEVWPSDRRLVLSPDGSAMAVVARRGDGPIAIYVRRADEATFRTLPGTEDALWTPSFSPDGEWVVFLSDDRAIRKVAVSGGQPTTLVPPSPTPTFRFPHWGDDGMIVFGGARGLYEVSEDGGEPTLLVEENAVFMAPRRLPRGRGIIGTSDGREGVWLYEPGADSLRTLVADGTDPTYVASGHFVYRHPEGGLWAAPFDLDALEITGPARPVLDDADGSYSVSDDGTLAYSTGGESEEQDVARLVQVPLDGGSPDTLPLGPWNMRQATFSPDGRRIAFAARRGDREHIFVYDPILGEPTQFTFERTMNWGPVWSPDGTRIAFATNDGALSETDVWVKPLDGSTSAAPLIVGDGAEFLGDWTPDDLLLYWRPTGDVETSGIRMRPLDDDSGDPAFPGSEGPRWQPRLSPDGDWLAHVTNESGETEVYVRRFPDGRGQRRVSEGGGFSPRWSPEGDALYYQDEDGRIVAARVQLEPTFVVLHREVVYEDSFRSWDVHPVEPRLLVTTDEADEGADASEERWFLVFNWFTELRERLGQGG